MNLTLTNTEHPYYTYYIFTPCDTHVMSNNRTVTREKNHRTISLVADDF